MTTQLDTRINRKSDERHKVKGKTINIKKT